VPGLPQLHWLHLHLPPLPQWWGFPQWGRFQGAFLASVLGPGESCGVGHQEAGEWTVGGGCDGRTGGGLQGRRGLATDRYSIPPPPSWLPTATPPTGTQSLLCWTVQPKPSASTSLACPLTLKVFLPIAAAWLLPSTGPSFLKDLLKPLHAQGAVKFVFLLLGEPRCPRTQTLWLWL
jgi:hypothetical protein